MTSKTTLQDLVCERIADVYSMQMTRKTSPHATAIDYHPIPRGLPKMDSLIRLFLSNIVPGECRGRSTLQSLDGKWVASVCFPQMRREDSPDVSAFDHHSMLRGLPMMNHSPEATSAMLDSELLASLSGMDERRSVASASYGPVVDHSANVYADQIVFRKGLHYDSQGRPAGRTGHGEAAERMEHLVDRLMMRDARHVGAGNQHNGADRIVDGNLIQTKYCRTASSSVESCFGRNGQFRYLDAAGNPMSIEVPKDQYEAAVRALEGKIREGKVPGVSDPEMARKIIRKGHFTYRQAYNVARFGTVESVVFDVATGAPIAIGAGGLSAVITYAACLWNGKDHKEALRHSGRALLDVGGSSLLIHVITTQLGRTGLEQALRGASIHAVRALGNNAARLICQLAGKGTLNGASAASCAAKLLRGNAVTAGVTIVVLSSADIARLVRGRISFGQFAKNLCQNAAGVGGGTVGWLGGSTVGSVVGGTLGSVIPGAGTALGAGIGYWVGGVVASISTGIISTKVAKAIGNMIREDDAVAMYEIFCSEIGVICDEYLLGEQEVGRLLTEIKKLDTGRFLTEMYRSADRPGMVRKLVEPVVEQIAMTRPRLRVPEVAEMEESILEEIVAAAEDPDEKPDPSPEQTPSNPGEQNARPPDLVRQAPPAWHGPHVIRPAILTPAPVGYRFSFGGPFVLDPVLFPWGHLMRRLRPPIMDAPRPSPLPPPEPLRPERRRGACRTRGGAPRVG